MKNTFYVLKILLTCWASLWSGFVVAQLSTTDACLKKVIQDAPDDLTIKELKALCNFEQAQDQGAVETRIESERKLIHDPFSIMAHRPNYLLFGAYNKYGYKRDGDEDLNDGNQFYKKNEAQFQLSLKVPFAISLLDKNIDLYGGYTVRSFWQVYDDKDSSPFRETNHEPEVWLQTYPNWRIFDFKNSLAQFGITHQSNGRSGINSRSWNRVFANAVFEKKHYAFGIKAWHRFPDGIDDNPEIIDYMGHLELTAGYKWNQHEISIMSRNNIESNFERGAVQLGWSFPLGKWHYLKGYVQYFNGYGESLVDYNEKVNRIGIGILLTDYL